MAVTHPFYTLTERIKNRLPGVLKQLDLQSSSPLSLQPPAPSIKADISLVVFQIAKENKKDLNNIAATIGQKCQEVMPEIIQHFSIVKGYVNFTTSHQYWIDFIQHYHASVFWKQVPSAECTIIEFSSPNTNKPLHLGHLRNNFLGEAISRILKAAGKNVHKTCVINDRGIHICKSMIAWQRYAKGTTPEKIKQKGDHFVGSYYVRFEQELKKEVQGLLKEVKSHQWHNITDQDIKKKIAGLLTQLGKSAAQDREVTAQIITHLRTQTPLIIQARNLLNQWEQEDERTIALWKRMNNWVYKGFKATYQTIGTSFDSTNYESNCYKTGKDIIQKGLKKDYFYQKQDGSIWIDLTAQKLGQKLLQRADGTSVYITQDIGLVQQRYEQYKFNQCIYVVGNEQEHHFRVLKAMLKKMGVPYVLAIQHLSYGMVQLPSGKMKSREGTVVDADQLIEDMVSLAAKTTKELGKMHHANEAEIEKLAHQIGIAALKFYLLRVNPQKGMLFNPEESIDLHGFTGPFIQYTYARIQSVLSKVTPRIPQYTKAPGTLSKEERELAIHLESFSDKIKEAAASQDPSQIANYAYNVAKKFNTFYAKHAILHAEHQPTKVLRIQLCYMTQSVLKNALSMLNIEAPRKM